MVPSRTVIQENSSNDNFSVAIDAMSSVSRQHSFLRVYPTVNRTDKFEKKYVIHGGFFFLMNIQNFRIAEREVDLYVL